MPLPILDNIRVKNKRKTEIFLLTIVLLSVNGLHCGEKKLLQKQIKIILPEFTVPCLILLFKISCFSRLLKVENYLTLALFVVFYLDYELAQNWPKINRIGLKLAQKSFMVAHISYEYILSY